VDSRSPAFAEDKLRGNDDSLERQCLANDATTPSVPIVGRRFASPAVYARQPEQARSDHFLRRLAAVKLRFHVLQDASILRMDWPDWAGFQEVPSENRRRQKATVCARPPAEARAGFLTLRPKAFGRRVAPLGMTAWPIRVSVRTLTVI